MYSYVDKYNVDTRTNERKISPNKTPTMKSCVTDTNPGGSKDGFITKNPISHMSNYVQPRFDVKI